MKNFSKSTFDNFVAHIAVDSLQTLHSNLKLHDFFLIKVFNLLRNKLWKEIGSFKSIEVDVFPFNSTLYIKCANYFHFLNHTSQFTIHLLKKVSIYAMIFLFS